MSSAKTDPTENREDTGQADWKNESPAARFNRLVFRKFQKALDNDPEVDLASLLPSEYSSRLSAMIVPAEDDSKTFAEGGNAVNAPQPQHKQHDQVVTIDVVHPLSPEVMSVLGYTDHANQSDTDLLQRLLKVIESIWDDLVV